ncbi:MAG: tetratricopeptide repeat protein [Proteobacteria bacterium]|nr:tetratricopeptide repeat protein [Pseudomonadota bacterium]
MTPRAWLPPLLLVFVVGGCAVTPRSASRDPDVAVARAALAAGDAAGALHASAQALAVHPGDPAALTVQGEALAALGQRDRAEASFRQALTADPAALPARIGLGRVLLRTDPKSAAAQFRAVLAVQPVDAAALNDLGIARDLRGQHLAAQNAYRAALAATPDLRAAQVNLGLSLALSGHAAEGVRMLRPLATTGAAPRVRQDLAAATAMAGHPAAAAALLAAEMPADQAAAAVRGYAALVGPADSPARLPGG